ncbi:hypothetical protein CB1_001402047 [Camelus ferus]|nr:hypothetical protein CB1_001402047 [Camelus ferus]
MSSLLMDLKYKKLFAIRFAKNYQQLQRDFMEDDHERAVSVTALSVQFFTAPTLNYERLQSDYVTDDHDREFSITDLSVQIFTVPSLARMLIVEENLMTIIIKTFMDHLRHRDAQGRFQFERYTASQAFKFKRVQSLILDLKYVLISKPTEWSDDLRQKFLEGFDAFLELLKCMQGMDPITRQVGQHIEMEPEWEAAFTLQMKLTHVISMMQDWCALDIFSTPDYGKKISSEASHKDLVQQNSTLIEEMLYLIIMLVEPGEAPNNSPSILGMLETLQNAPYLEVHKDMIRWILKTFHAIKKIRESSSTSPVTETEGTVMEESSKDKDKAERKRKAEIARLRREKIMAQMSEMQRHFIDENKELFQQTLELDASISAVLDNRNPYSESIKEMLTTFGTATYKVGLKVHPNEEDPRVPMMCWGSCAYTIQSIERILNDEDKPLFGPLPCRLVGLVLAFPALQCQDFSGISLGTGDLHIFHLVTMAHIVQILLTSCTEENGMDQENAAGEEELAVLALYKTIHQCTGSYPRESNKLIDLPEDYSSLINQASHFSCPKSGGDKSRAPTLCLVCGALLCSQSYCCQTELEGEDVGACTAHTYSCGSGVGIFLRVRECQVLFLAGKTKGCFYSPPYLDDYGETDQGLRERFKKIQKLWHQHSITEEIGHAQEANQTLVGIDWQHL